MVRIKNLVVSCHSFYEPLLCEGDLPIVLRYLGKIYYQHIMLRLYLGSGREMPVNNRVCNSHEGETSHRLKSPLLLCASAQYQKDTLNRRRDSPDCFAVYNSYCYCRFYIFIIKQYVYTLLIALKAKDVYSILLYELTKIFRIRLTAHRYIKQ